MDPRTLERDCSGHPNEEVSGLDLPGGVEARYSPFFFRTPLAQAVSVQARVGLGLLRLQERRFPVFVVNWSERKGLSFHFSTWLVGKSRRDIFLFVDYWCES